MNKNSKGFAHLILIVGIISVGIVAVGYLIVKNSSTNSKVVSPYSTKEECEVNNPGYRCEYTECKIGHDFWLETECSETRKYGWNPRFTDESGDVSNFKDWKTYRNEELGFEFQYPSDILIPADCLDGVNLYPADSKMPWSQYCNSPFITLAYSTGELSIEQLDPSSFEVTTEKMTVSGQKATKQTIRKTNEDTSGQDLTIYVQFKNDYYYIFTLNHQRFENEFNQILSTFRFIGYRKVVEQKLPSGIETSCDSDSDCQAILSYNNCDMYCVNNNPSNQATIDSIDQTCDPTLWDPPLSLDCGCINNNCELYNEQ